MNGAEIALAGYLAFGQLIPGGQQEIVKHSGLQAIHADGSVTLRLKEEGRETKEENGADVTIIRLRDERHPFEVTRYVKTWRDCAAVETWVEIRHREHGAVKLLRADSFASAVAVSADEVGVLSLTGKWAHEANVSESKVANGQIVGLASKASTRDAWESNAGMMVSFGPSDEESGLVLGVALEWTGTTSRRIRRSWDGKTTEVFAGVDMTSGPYTLDPDRVFRTPNAILVWSEKGRDLWGLSPAFPGEVGLYLRMPSVLSPRVTSS